MVCDVTDEAQVEAMVEQAQATFGGTDILVNNAVIFNQQGVLDTPVTEWTQQLTVILTGAFLYTKHIAQLMIDQGRRGSIINIISTAGQQGELWNVGYCTGKSGLLNFTRSVAMELAEFDLRVNSLTPTATDPTAGRERAARWGVQPQQQRSSSPRRCDLLADMHRGTPLQALPSPRPYARAAAFLASDNAKMITGTDFCVDAGAVARYWRWAPSVR